MNTSLQQAAQELIDRWDSPMWRYQQATTDVIAELRKALDAELAQSGEPVAWTRTKTIDARETTITAYLWFVNPLNTSWTPLYLHPPKPQAMTSTQEESRKIMLASELQALARKGCGDCYQQDCNWPECSPKAMALKQAAAQGEKP